jgi:glycosyltransferase involved in cell wall biosynthesis
MAGVQSVSKKILLATYSAESHSSYGIVTRELWNRLWRMHPDWDLYQQGWFHTSAEKVPWHVESTKTTSTPAGPRPLHEDRWGQLSFEPIVQRYRPDLVWTLGDAYMFEHMDRYRKSAGLRIIKHVAADGAPQPRSWGESLRQSDRTVPITEFGSKALEPVVGTKLPWIYHGVDVDRFTPMDRASRKRPESGKMSNKTFVLGFIGHSQWRKQTWNLFKLLRYLREGGFSICRSCGEAQLGKWDDIWGKIGYIPTICNHCGDVADHAGKQDVVLWYHTFDRANVEYNPEILKSVWGVEDAVIFTSRMTDVTGAPDSEMPELYRMFDAYVSLSGGEGFCIPLVEAMATGLPLVYTDYSGQAEVGAYGGLPVRYHELQPNTGVPVNRAIADVAHAVTQVMRLIRNDGNIYHDLSQKGIKAAREVFNWDVIALQWNKVIEEVLSTKYVKTIGQTIT